MTLFPPAGSVPETTEVTLTPVARLSGLPKGLRLPGGVQFSPENLALDKPAMLTIEVSKPAGAAALAWFDLGKVAPPSVYALRRHDSDQVAHPPRRGGRRPRLGLGSALDRGRHAARALRP